MFFRLCGLHTDHSCIDLGFYVLNVIFSIHERYYQLNIGRAYDYLKSHASPDSQIMLEALKTAVNKTLDKKKRLEQYAVV